jgi:uncharacterized protein (TIGR02246 family)
LSSLSTITDEQQITELMGEWRRLTAERDLDGLLELLNDDAIFLTPGNPPFGKKEFAEGFRKVSAKARIESTQDVKEIVVSGDLAYAWSHLTVRLVPEGGGNRSESSGQVLTIFQRSASGSWRLARDANLLAGAGNPDRVEG